MGGPHFRPGRDRLMGQGLLLAVALLLGVRLWGANAAGLTVALAVRDYPRAERELQELVKTEAGTALAKPTLQAHLEKLKVAFAAAIRGAETPLAKLKDPVQQARHQALSEPWRPLAKAALDFILDPKSYPPPPRMPFRLGDIQINQAIVEGKVVRAMAQWNLRELELATLLGIRPEGKKDPTGGKYAERLDKGQLQDPCEEIVPMVRYQLVNCLPGLVKVLPKWQGGFRKYQAARDDLLAVAKLAKPLSLELGQLPKIDPLILAVHYLFANQPEEAWQKAAELDRDRLQLLLVIAHRWLMFRDLKPAGDWTQNEIDALGEVNRYRLALGLPPLIGNEHVQQAAIGHSQYQATAGMSHSENDPARAAPFQRMALAGYRGGGGSENCAGTTDAVIAIWMWRMDSGHHHGLLLKARAAGLAARGPATFNTGSTTEDPLLDRWLIDPFQDEYLPGAEK